MNIIVQLDANETDEPIRFATAVIERCMGVGTFSPIEVDIKYRYLKEVNEHIDVYLKNLDYKGSEE